MGNNTQGRKWLLVINNPAEAGLDHAKLTEILHRFSPSHFCMVETSVPSTFEEWGTLSADNEDKVPEIFRLMQELRSGEHRPGSTGSKLSGMGRKQNRPGSLDAS